MIGCQLAYLFDHHYETGARVSIPLFKQKFLETILMPTFSQSGHDDVAYTTSICRVFSKIITPISGREMRLLQELITRSASSGIEV